MAVDRTPGAPSAAAGGDPADELLEVLDAEGRVVGLAPRARCHGDPSLAHRAVHVLVRNRHGEYFLQKRSRLKRVQPGRWDSSVGGHVDPGESWLEAARREISEELGIVLETSEQLEHLHDYVWRTSIETELVRTYRLDHDGPFRLHPDEIEEGRFWTEAELRTAAGSGRLTPNLEEELHRLGVLGVDGSAGR